MEVLSFTERKTQLTRWILLVAVTISEACRSAFDADSNSLIDFQKMQVKVSRIGAYDRRLICDSDLECR